MTGRDVIVEKPIFLNTKEVKEIFTLSIKNRAIVLEGFMHRYSIMYYKFLRYYKHNKNQIVGLKSSFFIPDFPKNTFRDNNNITSSCLYDIGCYGL